MTFKEVLKKYRAISFTEKEKGTKFERYDMLIGKAPRFAFAA